ncbi:hypothetical protein [Azospirillum agricola]|uniref:hypothetical protein n=1 Tax=Azospirillum agricola TaxID=1720247 RepID=UPI0015C4E1D5|nr:hypothetical protein [Azospirillum agricola]
MTSASGTAFPPAETRIPGWPRTAKRTPCPIAAAAQSMKAGASAKGSPANQVTTPRRAG